MTQATKSKILDIIERSAWTFVQAFAAALVVSGVLDAGTDIEAWKVGIIGAALSALKSVIAQQFGTGTAATVPAKDEPIPPADADWFGEGDH